MNKQNSENKAKYRILNASGKVMYTGANIGSWFTLEQAKVLINRENGEMIYEYSEDLQNRLWEVF
jgi:hypothetical protein